MRDADCVFCKIAKGDIPALRIWENETSFAFLDINPLAPGHTLLIPRQHFRDIRDVAPETLADLTAALPMLATAVMTAAGATGLNLLQNTGGSSGQAVFHIHFHLIPRIEDDGLGYRWNAGDYEPGQAEAVQAKIVDELERRS